MTTTRKPLILAIVVLSAGVLSVNAAGGEGLQGLPRAMPSDYAAAGVDLADSSQVPATSNHMGGIPRAMPSDYAIYFASLPSPASDGFDWGDAGVGAAAALAALLLALLAAIAVGQRWRFPRLPA